VIDFTIVAFCIFIIVKAMNSLKKKPARRRLRATGTTKREAS